MKRPSLPTNLTTLALPLTLALAFTTLTASLFAGPVSTITPLMTTTQPDNGWWFRAAPYVWATAIEGDVAIGPLSAPVDISIGDTTDSLDMAFMGVFEAGYGRVSAGLDTMYAQVSQDIPGRDLLFRSYRFEQEQWLLTPFVAFRAIDTERSHLDLLAGARITLLEAELTGRFARRGGQVNAERDIDFIDPIIGLRGQAALGQNWFFRYNGDIGGIGTSSELVWQAFAGLGLNVTPNLSLAAGYRAMGVDYDKDALEFDTISHGPVIGLEVKF